MSDLRTLIEINCNLLPLQVIVKYEVNEMNFFFQIFRKKSTFYKNILPDHKTHNR